MAKEWACSADTDTESGVNDKEETQLFGRAACERDTLLLIRVQQRQRCTSDTQTPKYQSAVIAQSSRLRTVSDKQGQRNTTETHDANPRRKPTSKPQQNRVPWRPHHSHPELGTHLLP